MSGWATPALLACAALASAVTASETTDAPRQVVRLLPASPSVAPDAQLGFQLILVLQGLAPTSGIAGLGVRLHYDAARLRLEPPEAVFADGRLAMDRTPMPDIADSDDDPTTDTVVTIAWANLAGDWRRGSDLQTVLLRGAFTARQPGLTTVRITTTGSDGRALFTGEPATIAIVAESDPAPRGK